MNNRKQSAPTSAGLPYSPALKSGSQLYVSGQLPLDPTDGRMPESVGEQTRQCMKNMEALLKQKGYSMQDVVKTTVMLTDLAEFGAMNSEYEKFFRAPYPARSACQVAGLVRNAKVEIDCIAIKHRKVVRRRAK